MDEAQKEKVVEEWFESKIKEKFSSCCNDCKGSKSTKGYTKYIHKSGMDGVYCVGMIGAAIYYISTATTFWVGVLGLLKAVVWPAFLVYETLKLLGA